MLLGKSGSEEKITRGVFSVAITVSLYSSPSGPLKYRFRKVGEHPSLNVSRLRIITAQSTRFWPFAGCVSGTANGDRGHNWVNDRRNVLIKLPSRRFIGSLWS